MSPPADEPGTVPRHPWPGSTSILAVLGAIGCGAILALVGVVALGVQGVRALAQEQSLARADLRQLHRELINSAHDLAERSGMATSADLCPVRFHLRFNDGIGAPSLAAVQASLRSETRELSPVASPGLLRFGLMPPGRYALTLTAHETYQLYHEFDVLPGVPIDRLIECPKSDPPLDLVQIPLELSLPDALRDRDLIWVCRITRGPVSVGPWTWRPAAEDETTVEASVQNDLPASRPIDGMSSRFSLAHARLREITVRMRVGPNRDAVAEIARIRFSGSTPSGSADQQTADLVLDQPAPEFHGDINEPTQKWRWTVSFPQAAFDTVHNAMMQRRDANAGGDRSPTPEVLQ